MTTWTSREQRLVRALVRNGADAANIMHALQDRHTLTEVMNFIKTDARREAARKRARSIYARDYSKPHAGLGISISNPIPPRDVIAERDARLNVPRTLTQALFGDPPFPAKTNRKEQASA